MQREFMTQEECMEFLDIKKPTLFAWIRNGRLKPTRLGKSRKQYFFRDTIVEMLRQNEGKPYGYKKG